MHFSPWPTRGCVMGLFPPICPQPLPLSSSLTLFKPYGLSILSSSSTPPFFFFTLSSAWNVLPPGLRLPGASSDLSGLCSSQTCSLALCSPSSHHLLLFFQSAHYQPEKKNVLIYCIFANRLSSPECKPPGEQGSLLYLVLSCSLLYPQHLE